MRRQNKSFDATLSDEESDDSDEKGEYSTTFASIPSTDDFISCVEGSISHKKNTLSCDQLHYQCEEDSLTCAAQKERIQELFDENQRLLDIVSSLKQEPKEVKMKYENMYH